MPIVSKNDDRLMKILKNRDFKRNLISLWRQFLPLSLSDIAMACSDPAVSTTLAHLPSSRINIAAVGIAKSIAVFLESPIISILHASNALAATRKSRRALWKLMLIAGIGLSLIAGLLTIPVLFESIVVSLFNLSGNLAATVHQILILMIPWTISIAWRRYFQGLLIHRGNTKAIANASIARLFASIIILAIGWYLKMAGGIVAGLALIVGVIVEAILITIAAKRSGAINPPSLEDTPKLPSNLSSVWRFYYPLASSMLILWGGKATLISIVARDDNADLAVAAWTAAWGLVLVIANATRMVQQVIIRNRGKIDDRTLVIFAFTVGIFFSCILLFVSTTPLGDRVIESFFGGDRALVTQIRPILSVCSLIPLLFSLQNALQGFSIDEGHTRRITLATWVSTTVLLLGTLVLMHMGIDGALAAAIGMVIASIGEIIYLFVK
jgi:Na+-driven multidrug efflux pump